MNPLLFTLALLAAPPSQANSSPEPEPSSSPTPTLSPAPSTGGMLLTYSRTLPPTSDLRDAPRDLSFTSGSVSELSLAGADRVGPLLWGIGMGYSWIGRLERGAQPLPHSPDHWFFLIQADWAPPVFSMLYFGGAFRIVPKWAVSKPIDDPNQEKYRFMGGIGSELYAGIDLPYGIFGQIGYRWQFLDYEERRLDSLGGGSAGAFTLGYRSVVLSVGFRPERFF